MYQVGADRGDWIQPNFEIPERVGKFIARVESTEVSSYTQRF